MADLAILLDLLLGQLLLLPVNNLDLFPLTLVHELVVPIGFKPVGVVACESVNAAVLVSVVHTVAVYVCGEV